MQSDGLLLIKNLTKPQQKLPRRGNQAGNQAWQGWTGQDMTGYDDKLTKEYKHKEIMKGANEEGNEVNRWGKLTNNQ